MSASDGRVRRQLVTIRDRQRTRAVDVARLRRITNTLLVDHLGVGEFHLNICLVSALEMARLNEKYLRHKGATDVLAFDYRDPITTATRKIRNGGSLSSSGGEGQGEEVVVSKTVRPKARSGPLFGEIFVCVEEACAQARRFRTTWHSELVRYLIHGLLHLCGYNDQLARRRQEMKRVENRLLSLLSAQFNLRSLATGRFALRKPASPTTLAG